MTVDPARVTRALRDVFDPELGMSVVDLGLIYDLQIVGDRVDITMTLTASGCPLRDAMAEWVRQAIGSLPGVGEVHVVVTFEPAWTPDRIGRDARP